MNALICGSFDPVTLGHIDLIRRAAGMFGKVTVGIFSNDSKKYWFTKEKRLEMLQESVRELSNVHAEICYGLVSEYALNNGIEVIVKGLRNAVDFDYEMIMAKTNRVFAPSVETVFLPAYGKNEIISSSMVKIVFENGGNVSDFVPECVLKELENLNINKFC